MPEGAASSTERTSYVFDACVLIDLVGADPNLLRMIATHLGAVVIPTPILGEVGGLDEEGCATLGLTLFEPTFAQLAEAANGGGRLSFHDWVCLIAARDAGWTCVTNDGTLLRVCQQQTVVAIRGLRPILTLVERGHLHHSKAIVVMKAIQTNNGYISEEVVSAFIAELRLAVRSARKR